MKTIKRQPTTANAEPPKRWLDPDAEYRDHANQWDLSSWQDKSPSTPSAAAQESDNPR